MLKRSIHSTLVEVSSFLMLYRATNLNIYMIQLLLLCLSVIYPLTGYYHHYCIFSLLGHVQLLALPGYSPLLAQFVHVIAPWLPSSPVGDIVYLTMTSSLTSSVKCIAQPKLQKILEYAK
jgi:hypothetical protein